MSEYISLEVQADPTLFTKAFRHYRRIFEALAMMQPDPSNIDAGFTQADLESFQRENGNAPYVCAFSGCPRSSDGFKSETERKGHESRHLRPFRCNETKCDFSTIGFATARQSNQHFQKYHASMEQSVVPSFGRTSSQFKEHSSISQSPSSGDIAIPSWPGGLNASESVELLSPRPTPPGPLNHQAPRVGNELANLNPDVLPAEQKCVGTDWFAVFNPELPRVLDIKLLHTLLHESVVCCVRFSADGKYVATGCNWFARIYDADTGHEVCKLRHDSLGKEDDVYIRSICFSPDGQYLATGGEDRLLRVRLQNIVSKLARR
jgi:WD domain, G-beta repeat